MTQLIFWIVVLSAMLSIGGVLLSWGRPAVRIWPPPRAASWQTYLSWIFIEITMVGPLVLGVLDCDGWIAPGWVRLLAGVVLVSSGFGVGLAAMRRLLVLSPFAEEPWLRERFGQEYEEYSQRVPRFLGFPRASRLPD